VRYLQMRSGYKAMSPIEQRYAEINQVRESSGRLTWRDKIRGELRRIGLGDDLFPFFAAAGFLYLCAVVPLRFTGLPQVATFIGALPLSCAIAWTLVTVRSQRRRAACNKLLVDLRELVTGQVQGGVGAERALMIVVPQMPEPIREEMARALASGQAGKDLVGSMRELAGRYPSRAFDMFIAAMEIDRAEGQAIGPALRQASDMLRRDFALAAEARAEISQTKFEFLAVAGLVIALCLYLVLGGSSETRDAFRTMGGVIALTLAGVNLAGGGFRFFRMMAKIKGDT
jgi:tight adherence protein B